MIDASAQVLKFIFDAKRRFLVSLNCLPRSSKSLKRNIEHKQKLKVVFGRIPLKILTKSG